MKKFIVILMVAAMAVGFSSCDKEGYYNPNKRISEIAVYFQGQGQVTESWVWSKKTLDKINYADGSSALFAYDKKNRLTKITMAENNFTSTNAKVTEFTYDGKYLSKIVYKKGTEVIAETNVSHSSGDISELNTTIYNYELDLDAKALNKTFDRFFTPIFFDPIIRESVVKSAVAIAKEKAASNSKGNMTLQAKLSWVGENVTHIDLRSNFGGNTVTTKQDFKYDDKINPFYNCFSRNIEAETINLTPVILSKNNILVYDQNINGNLIRVEYTYNYSDDFPTEQYDIINGIITRYKYK